MIRYITIFLFLSGCVTSMHEQISSSPLVQVIRESDVEHLFVIGFDEKEKPVGIAIVATGDCCSVHVSWADIMVAVDWLDVDTIVIGHNHPNGTPFPSYDDYVAAHTWKKYAKLTGITLYDTVVVTNETLYFIERAELYYKEVKP